MSNEQNIVPTMHLSSSQIDDPREQIIYTLRQFTSIPSGITDAYHDKIISMQYIRAKSGHDSNKCAAEVTSALKGVIGRILSDYDVSVTATPKFIDNIRYNIVIEIVAAKDDDMIDYTGLIVITDDNQITFNPYQGE